MVRVLEHQEAPGVMKTLYGDTVVTSTALDESQLWIWPCKLFSLPLKSWL